MFGKWIGRSAAKSKAVEIETLASLAPYGDLSAGDLEIVASMATRATLPQGLIEKQLPTHECVFLQSGSVQIQTHTGWVLQLKADSPQARFPLPFKPRVGSIYAAETSTFLIVPASASTVGGATIARGPKMPELTGEEADALARLKDHFRKQHAELPSLPDLALKIGKAIDDANNANDDIARLIQLDPALAARILGVVNSAAFGGLSKISSIQQATARLGRNKVRSLVYSCLLKSIFRNSSQTLKKRMEALWQHSAYVAALSFVLGRETPGIDPEQALLSGLVHDIGSVAVLGGINHFPVLARREPVLDFVIAHLRTAVGKQTLEQWGLETQLQDVVENAENWFRVGTAIPENPDVVILAQLHSMIGTPAQAQLPRIDTVPAFAKLARGELSPMHSLSLLDEAEADVREIRALISGN